MNDIKVYYQLGYLVCNALIVYLSLFCTSYGIIINYQGNFILLTIQGTKNLIQFGET